MSKIRGFNNSDNFRYRAVRYLLDKGFDSHLDDIPETDPDHYLKSLLSTLFKTGLKESVERSKLQALAELLGEEESLWLWDNLQSVLDLKIKLVNKNEQILEFIDKIYPDLKINKNSNPALQAFYRNELIKKQSYLQDLLYFSQYAEAVRQLILTGPLSAQQISGIKEELNRIDEATRGLEIKLNEQEKLLKEISSKRHLNG